MKERNPDTEFDTINLIFAAALSAYIGVTLSDKSLAQWETLTLMLMLAALVPLILGVREVYRSLAGETYFGAPWPWNLVVVLASGAVVQLLAYTLPSGGPQFSAIFRTWMAVYIVTLGVTLLRGRKSKK